MTAVLLAFLCKFTSVFEWVWNILHALLTSIKLRNEGDEIFTKKKELKAWYNVICSSIRLDFTCLLQILIMHYFNFKVISCIENRPEKYENGFRNNYVQAFQNQRSFQISSRPSCTFTHEIYIWKTKLDNQIAGFRETAWRYSSTAKHLRFPFRVSDNGPRLRFIAMFNRLWSRLDLLQI